MERTSGRNPTDGQMKGGNKKKEFSHFAGGNLPFICHSLSGLG